MLPLVTFVRKHKLGEIFAVPLDVVLDDHNIVQPVMFFVSKPRSGIIGPKNIRGIPDLIAEILSPWSLKKNKIKKKELYEKFGLKEYWMVDFRNHSIEVYSLIKGRLVLDRLVSENEKRRSVLFPGFEIEVEQIFQVRNNFWNTI